MADDFDRNLDGPHDWSQALAALPMESAPADAWMRVSDALDAQAAVPAARAGLRQPSRAAWYAMAAAVAVVAAIPLIEWSGEPASSPSPGPSIATAAPPVVPVRASTGQVVTDSEAMQRDGITATSQVAATEPAAAETSRGSSTARREPQPTASTPAPKEARQIASASTRKFPAAEDRLAQQTPATAVRDDVATRTEATPDPLQPLYAESAQLEALVALARDDRVASASGALLTGEIGSRIDVIDALLAQPGLSPSERTTLWRQRIDALRQLAGVESTERWLAAHGEAFGDALVRVD